MLHTLALSVAILGAAAPDARAAGATIVVLHEADLAGEEGRLIEALRIYTRDLACEVRLQSAAPAQLSPERLDSIEKEAAGAGASIVLWAHRRDDGQALFYIFDAAARDLRETEVGRLGVDHAATEVALKARALLVRVARRAPVPTSSEGHGRPSAPEADRPSAIRAPSDPSERTAAPATPTAEPPPAPPSRPAPGPPVVAVHATPPAPPVAPRYAVGATFGLVSPLDTTWLRTGLVVTGAVRVGHLRSSSLWLSLDGAFMTRPHARVSGFDVSLRDVPLAAGVQAAWSSARTSFSIGPRASLHLLEVGASGADGRTGASRRFTTGLGGLARGEARLTHRLAATLGVSVEAVVPAQEFTAAGQRALSTGGVLVGATAGLVVLLP
jgi:hypothetical protein